MGCDIHAYLEFYNKDLALKNNVDDKLFANYWVDVFASDITFYRNYRLFNIMSSGVRGLGGGFDAKGIPNSPKLSWQVAQKYYLRVVDSKDMTSKTLGENLIERKEAAEHIKAGAHTITLNEDTFIANPYWHSASYFTLTEMIQVRRKYLIDTIKYDDLGCVYTGKKRKDALKNLEDSDEYDLMKLSFEHIESAPLNAAIASMIAIQKSGDYTTRLVFWFDS